MLFPGYMLNPGDMFQVEPERAMFATGAFKDSAAASTSDDASAEADSAAALDAAVEDNPQEEAAAERDDAELDSGLDASDAPAATKALLKSMRDRAKTLLAEPKTLSGKQKQELRAFTKSVRSTMSRAASASPSAIDDLEVQLQTITSKITASNSTSTTSSPEAEDAEPSPEVAAAIEQIESNPHDPSKPYLTPWRPRDFMSAFAFIPRYLEVHHAICSAVYLRHPVVKPGLAEVPTPFHPETGQLAFNWYLRRR